MSDLKTRVTEDIKAAMRAGDKSRLSVLRMLSAELKQREVVEQQTLNDTVVMAAIEKMVKQRRDSEKQFTEGNRPELAAQEAAEIVVLQGYLPQPLSAGLRRLPESFPGLQPALTPASWEPGRSRPAPQRSRKRAGR